MINWRNCTYGDKVRLVDVDGDVFDGIVSDVTEVQERSDLERQEDGICIIVADGRHIEFYENDIKSVSRRYDDGEIIDVRFIPQVDAFQQSA